MKNNYAVPRNQGYAKAKVCSVERHNERKNETYKNDDIVPERAELNYYFKKPTFGYLKTFDKLCEDKIISTRGLKDDAKIIDELAFDVNTTYFHERGGYEFAKEFYSKAYEFAVDKIGGEQYIISAVMHADERNKAVSEEVGEDVYHYHLHVVYVPVVSKDIYWSKRCKDKNLVGTLKETITQVSDSKKWASHYVTDQLGNKHLEKSYSVLQDEFYNFLVEQGYTDVERGEKGSTTKHKTVVEYKVDREKKRLQQTKKRVDYLESAFETLEEKRVAINSLNDIETKPAFIDKTKIIIDSNDFKKIRTLAKKQIISQGREKEVEKENARLYQKVDELENKVFSLENVISKLNSIEVRLKQKKDKLKLAELEKFHDVTLKFLDEFKLREAFNKFRQMMTKTKTKKRNEVER